MRKIDYIFVHCTATSPHTSVKALMNGFKARGWHYPGYHYVITADAELTQLLPEEEIANGVAGYNRNAIHIAYIGGVDEKMRPKDTRGYGQKILMEGTLKMLHWRYPDAKILGHCEMNPQKACPSYDVQKDIRHWLFPERRG